MVDNKGFTIIEIVVSSVVIGIMAISTMAAYVALNSTAIFAQQKKIGTELATNRIEYLKSLPYDNLAVVGGAIPHPSPLPNTENVTLDNVNYEIKTSINYIDDAFDGCANYPDEATKNLLCRNLPEPASASSDLNPADYKIANVKVYVNSKKVSELDTNIAARVAETDSTTGSLVVRLIDSSGNPVSGANVSVINSSLGINVNDSSDSNGVAIFYGLTPDGTNGYVVSATKSNYSSLTTIASSGSLAPNFPNQNIIVQQSSSVTLTIDPMGQYSLLAETTDPSGSAIANLKLYAKGGQKKYSETLDTSYYSDNMSPSDSRPTSDGSGNLVLQNLTPSNYIFCGDNGDTNCSVGGSNYYLVAAIPYVGSNQIGPINIPSYSSSSPPSTTFPYGGNNYYQKARLMLTTNSNFPRILNISNGGASKSSGTHTFSISGVNLSGSSVIIKNSGGDMTAACAGTDTLQDCEVDLSSANVEQSNITLTKSGNVIDIPNGTGLIGGINVTP